MKVNHLTVYEAMKIVEDFLINNKDKLVANVKQDKNILKVSVKQILRYYNIPSGYGSQIGRAIWQLHYLNKIRILEKGNRRKWYVIELLDIFKE